MSAAIVDGVQGMAELLSFGAVSRYRDSVAKIQQKLSIAQSQMGHIGSLQKATLGFLGQLATLTVLSAASGLVGTGQIEGLYLGVIALAVLTSFEALQPLSQAAQVVESNLEAASRLFAVADTPPAIREPASPRPLEEQWDVEVRELSFSYSTEEAMPGGQVLKEISFNLPYGKHMAVVGLSGAGKTTLVRLLARLWEYQSGSILLNGCELNQFSGDDLRKKLAVVPQNPYLFTTTILDNLRIARPQAGMDEIVQAARLAHIHDFIAELPQGYNTWVGEHGLHLSAGERQRIAVARELLIDAPLLVLDEATANLDVLGEGAILASIRDAWQGRSLLVITHRLVGMEGFDEILVMDRGRVAERGRHAELLAAGGLYWRMWQAQQRV
jgi:ABC-type multidrug transport system fused ATPase/permease subunit